MEDIDMPRRTKQQRFENYDLKKQAFRFTRFSCDMAQIGHVMDNNYDKVKEAVSEAMSTQVGNPGDKPILGLDMTKGILPEDHSELITEIKKSYKRTGEGIRKYDGPFKGIIESNHYITNPSNGDILDALVDQPSLEKLVASFGAIPSITSNVEVETEVDDPINKGQKKKITHYEQQIDLENANKRKEALGEFADYITDYYVAIKDLFKVIYDRQKAEKEDKKGLDTAYMLKYVTAIDNLTAKFDKLKSESEKRYARTDLTHDEKDLTKVQVRNPRAGKPTLDKKGIEPDIISVQNLNNPLGDITSSDPNKANRDANEVAVANLKGQSQALKNGWPLAEFKLLGYISEAKANTENRMKAVTLTIKETKESIKSIDENIERYRKENNEEELQEELSSKKNLEKLIAEYEQKLKDVTAANKDINVIYDKYFDLKNPDFLTRREALKDAEEFNNKYKDKDVINIATRTFEAMEEEIKDPYELEGKTRLEQVESMLKSITDVDKFLRSSDNFREVKSGLEKLVEMARKYPDMNDEQFWEYQKQVNKVKGSINKYIKGKNKEADDYAKKNKGKKLKRTEYTSKRINTVSDLWEKLDCHMILTSDKFTKEYTGNVKERALAKYKRLIRFEGEYRQSILGRTNLKGDGELIDIFDITKEYDSFIKSIYIERMKHRFDTDPTFTPEEFLNSLSTKEIHDGVRKIKKEIDPDFKKRIYNSIKERVLLDGEEDSEYLTDDRYFYDIVNSDSPVLNDIPIGVGHDYIRFEYRMELIRLGQADESVFDKDDYIDGPQYEPDEWEIKKYNIKKPEEKEPEVEEEKKIENKEPEKEENKPEIKEPKKEDKKAPKKEENKNEIKEENKAPKKTETKNVIKEIKKAPKKEENKNVIKEEKKAPKKEEKKPEKKNLAAQIVEALTGDRLYELSIDSMYRSIVNDLHAHAKKEKPGENTKISDETLTKMARYVDKISDRADYTADDFTRRHLVESAFKQYRQGPEDFKKNCSTFNVKFPTGIQQNGASFCYRSMFHEKHENRISEIGAAYLKNPENKKLEAAVMDEAYQVLMVNIVDLTVGRQKGETITRYNEVLDSTGMKDQRDFFIRNELSNEFKKNFQENVLKMAKAGKFTGGRTLDVAEETLAKMLDNNKKKKDVRGERNTRNLIDKLKLHKGTIDKKVEVMNRNQAAIKK